MNRLKTYIFASVMAIAASIQGNAVGWPADFEGVMLQGFYWDSYKSDTKWTKLEAQADELSQSFKLIWVPNSAKSQGGLGYLPVYWFTNHNSDMGTENEFKSMVAAFKERGTGLIADVVINHRCGKSNWTDFPKESWNGTTYQIGLDGICKDDEVASQAGQGKPTGAYDTGDKYDGARDLDHTNANVQDNCKNYMKCLLEKYGYAGFRLDYSKGYKGQYVKTYNQYAKPTYCVGEYWDGSYNALASWIESTGRESAAFDFAFKYALNNAFAANDMSKLVWMAGQTPQPAGLIHSGYQQLAVTFIDNHDTYRDQNKFTGNVLAANAFMICSPGTPCVFMEHWKQYKSQIKAMIAVRNACGVTNTSSVKVLKYTRDCYMAEVTGKNGKLVVKVGSSMESPSGYTDADIRATGNGYCIWSKLGTSPEPTVPSNLYVLGNLASGSWKTNNGVKFSADGTTFTAQNVELVSADAKDPYSYFTFTTTLGADWDAINGSDRYGAASKDESVEVGSTVSVISYYAGESASGAFSWKIKPGVYTFTVDFKSMTLKIEGKSDENLPDPPTPPIPGDKLTIYWDNSTANWTTPHIHYWGGEESTWPGVAMTKVEGNIWKYTVPAGTTGILFNAGNGDATKTPDFVAVNNHIYNKAGDQGEYSHEVTPVPTPEGEFYLTGEFCGWETLDVNKFTQSGNTYTIHTPVLDGQFKIKDASSDWKLSFGGDTGGEDIPFIEATVGENLLYANSSVNLSADNWKNVRLSFTYNTGDNSIILLIETNVQGVDAVMADENGTVEFFNMQGIRVDNPTSGLYIRRCGSKVEKVLVK